MRQKKLKVGIIGGGKGGKAILGIFLDEPDIKIAGVSDIDLKAEAIKLAESMGIPVTDDYRALVKKDLQIIIDVTGSEEVHNEIQRIKKPETELMGGKSTWILWKLIEERKKRIEENERTLEKREILYKLGLVANNANSMRGAGQSIADYAARLTGMPACSVAIFDERRENMFLLASSGLSQAFEKNLRWEINKGSLTSALFNRKEPIVISDLGRRKKTNPLLVKEGIRSMMACPLITEGTFMGFICVSDFKKRTFDREEVTLFSLFTMNASLILERIKNIEEMRLLSVTDGLTGIYNHRYFMEQMQKEIDRAERQKNGFAFLLFDIDHFKSYNDAYGHLEGNNVLKMIAALLMRNVRANDTVARFGGEEFCILALDLNNKRAPVLLGRLLRQIGRCSFPHRKVTLSGGAAFYPKDGRTCTELIKKADDRLYKAKGLGRNRFIIS